MTLSELISLIEPLLPQNRIGEALQLLIEYFGSKEFNHDAYENSTKESLEELEETYKTIIIKSASFRRLLEAFQSEIIDWQTYDTNSNIIVLSLLQILDTLKKIAYAFDRIDWDRKHMKHMFPPVHLYKPLEENIQRLFLSFEDLASLIEK